MAKKKKKWELCQRVFFFLVCLFASVTFRIARVPLHSSIASQSKRFSGYTAYPENQNPIYLTYQGRRAARFQTDDELEVLQGGRGGDLMDRTWWRCKRGRFFFFSGWCEMLKPNVWRSKHLWKIAICVLWKGLCFLFGLFVCLFFYKRC